MILVEVVVHYRAKVRHLSSRQARADRSKRIAHREVKGAGWCCLAV